jgi:hypothetical protein
MSQPNGAPHTLNERANDEACRLLDVLNILANYAEQHPSVKLTIARCLYETVQGQRVLRRFYNATGLTLKIDATEAQT